MDYRTKKTTPQTTCRTVAFSGLAAALLIGTGACQPVQSSAAAADRSDSHGQASDRKNRKGKRLPSGKATATSFWDANQPTASGRKMRYKTIASPYWPLGTKVKIIYKGKSATGIVDDFGPAEWAVAQHRPPAIIDLSEPMMSGLTGSRQNSVTITFKVIEWGDGRTYRKSGTGHDLAMGD